MNEIVNVNTVQILAYLKRSSTIQYKWIRQTVTTMMSDDNDDESNTIIIINTVKRYWLAASSVEGTATVSSTVGLYALFLFTML